MCTKLSAPSVSVDSSNVDCFHLNTFTNSQNFALKIYLMAQIISHYLYDCVSVMTAYILHHACMVEYMEIVLTVLHLRPILNIGSFLFGSVGPIVILGT